MAKGPVFGGHYLGNVQHQRTFWVACIDGLGVAVIGRSFVQVAGTVLLGDDRGRQMKHNHIEQIGSGRLPLAHGYVHQPLSAL